MHKTKFSLFHNEIVRQDLQLCEKRSSVGSVGRVSDNSDCCFFNKFDLIKVVLRNDAKNNWTCS